MIRSMARVGVLCLLCAWAAPLSVFAQEEQPPVEDFPGVKPAPAEQSPADDNGDDDNGEGKDKAAAVVAPGAVVVPGYVPYAANYGANYFYPYYAYAPGYVYPAYSYTPISPVAYPVYGYYPYYYGAYASPYYAYGYGYGYVPYATYGGYYTWYNPYPGVGWYTGYAWPMYMGW